jgi:hypothetical protein
MRAMCFCQDEGKIIKSGVAFAKIAEGLTTDFIPAFKMLISWRDFPGINFYPIYKLHFYNELQAKTKTNYSNLLFGKLLCVIISENQISKLKN